jgi:hypothetical protein
LSPEIVLDFWTQAKSPERVSANPQRGSKFRGSGRVTAYPEITPKMEFCRIGDDPTGI